MISTAISRRGGFTLVELLFAIVLIGILSGLAVPSLRGFTAKMRLQSALEQITADLYYARTLAVRSGRPVVLRFNQMSSSPRCYDDSYSIVVLDAPERVAKNADLELLASRDCVDIGAVDSIPFDSRGLLFRNVNNRTVRVSSAAWSDSISISRLGRVYRRY